jgi:protease-4
MRLLCTIFILTLVATFSGCALVNVALIQPPSPLEEQILEGDGSKKILLLDISGTISEQEQSGGILGRSSASMVSLIRESLQKAEKDDHIKGIILRINSPGGTVTASDIIYHDIIEFKKRRKIPVHACIMSTGASGGYLLQMRSQPIPQPLPAALA